MWIVNCRSSFLGLLLAMSVQIWAVLSVTAMRLLGRKNGGGRSVSPESRSGFLHQPAVQVLACCARTSGLAILRLKPAKHSQRCQSQLRALGLLSMTLHGCCAANVRVHVDSTDDLACTGGLSRTFCLRQIHRQVIGLRIASHCARKDPPFRIRSDESSHLTHCVGPCGFGLCHLRWLVA